MIAEINFNMRCTQLMKNEELRIKNEGGNFLERKVSFFIELNKKIYIY